MTHMHNKWPHLREYNHLFTAPLLAYAATSPDIRQQPTGRVVASFERRRTRVIGLFSSAKQESRAQ